MSARDGQGNCTTCRNFYCVCGSVNLGVTAKPSPPAPTMTRDKWAALEREAAKSNFVTVTGPDLRELLLTARRAARALEVEQERRPNGAADAFNEMQQILRGDR